MIRVVVSGPPTTGATVQLDDDEAHHLDVRRVAAGEPVELLDGAGHRGMGTLIRNGKRWNVEVSDIHLVTKPATTVLAVAAGDRDRFLSMLEKSTELGATRIIPLETEYTAGVSTRYRASAYDKGARRIREAAKQSGNAWFPQLDPILDLKDLEQSVRVDRWLLGDASGDTTAIPANDAVGWVIGPEGGLSAPELAWLRDHLGATSIALGPHVLRFETAAAAALTFTWLARRA